MGRDCLVTCLVAVIKHPAEAASGRKRLITGPQSEDVVMRALQQEWDGPGQVTSASGSPEGQIDAGAWPLIGSTHTQD